MNPDFYSLHSLVRMWRPPTLDLAVLLMEVMRKLANEDNT